MQNEKSELSSMISLGETAVGLVKDQTPAEISLKVADKIVNLIIECKKIEDKKNVTKYAIDAWERTEIEKIKSNREMIESIMKKIFDERSENFKFLFQQIDMAMQSNNNDQLASHLSAFVAIAQSSPLKPSKRLCSFIRNSIGT
jgi:hypothetical protein